MLLATSPPHGALCRVSAARWIIKDGRQPLNHALQAPGLLTSSDCLLKNTACGSKDWSAVPRRPEPPVTTTVAVDPMRCPLLGVTGALHQSHRTCWLRRVQ